MIITTYSEADGREIYRVFQANYIAADPDTNTPSGWEICDINGDEIQTTPELREQIETIATGRMLEERESHASKVQAMREDKWDSDHDGLS